MTDSVILLFNRWVVVTRLASLFMIISGDHFNWCCFLLMAGNGLIADNG